MLLQLVLQYHVMLDLARYGGGDAVKLHAHVTSNKGNSGNATMQCIHCTIMVIALAKLR